MMYMKNLAILVIMFFIVYRFKIAHNVPHIGAGGDYGVKNYQLSTNDDAGQNAQ